MYCTELPKNTSEEETETTDASTCNLTPSSDIKLRNIMNKIPPMKRMNNECQALWC